MSLFGTRFQTWLQRSRMNREMDEELRSHIQHRADDLERSGLVRPAAERQARIEFGSYERFKEEIREEAGGHFLEVLAQDLRFGWRMMRKSPGFTAVAIVTLGCGICANSVVFSVLNALVLQPMDLPQARNLYMIDAAKHDDFQSYPNYVDLRDRSRTLAGVLAFDMAEVGLDAGQGSSRAIGYESSGNYFDVLGIQPYLGRFFHGADEHGPDSAPYIVLSYAYWQSHFQGDRGVAGRTIQLNKYPYTVLGVAPPQFRGTSLFFAPDFWAPLVDQAQLRGESLLNVRGVRSLWVVGRLKSGVSVEQLQTDLAGIAATLAKTYPSADDGMKYSLARPELMGDYIGKAVRAFVAGLTLLAGLILLAACANLSSLFAARAADRAKEIALRLALGSSRSRILRQLLTEALMIALAGGVVGLAASLALLPSLSAWQPVPDYPVSVPVHPDAAVYAVALLLALASGLIFGMAPVRQVFGTEAYQVIKAGATGKVRRLTLRDLLLGLQIAICALLVTASLVAVRGLMRSLNGKFGFEPKGAMLVDTELGRARYSRDQQPIMQRRMLDAVLALPGVSAAGYVDQIPLFFPNTTKVFAADATDLRASKAVTGTVVCSISPGYFGAAGTRLLAGRAFNLHDDKSSPRVAVVNQEFARQMFGSTERALGGRYKISGGTLIQIVGVAEDGKYESLTEDPQPAMFFPLLQAPAGDTWLVVRWSGDPEQLSAGLRQALRRLDPGLQFSVKTWYKQLDTTLFPARVATVSLGALGGLGALLSMTGLFGMAAYSVSKRMREFGIRMALGARRKEVLRAALGRTFRLLAFGSAVGLLLGVAASKVLSVIVYQATPRDPLVLGGVMLAMFTIGLLAGWIPARRALGTDPAKLLREQ
jgi:predicted permease